MSDQSRISTQTNKVMKRYLIYFVTLLLCYIFSVKLKASQGIQQKKDLLHKSFQNGLNFIKEACSDLKTHDQNEVPVSMFLFDPASKLLMCKTAKHGSTTWAQYFVSIFQNGYGYIVHMNSTVSSSAYIDCQAQVEVQVG